jgi:hypothetical protein
LENITVLDYHGVIQYETIGELIHRFKHQVHKMGIQIGTYKRILLVMIESLENIMKHSPIPINIDAVNQDFKPALSIVKDGNHYMISSSNLLNIQAIPSLKDKLDHLNNLDKEGLKNYYKETITNGVFTNTGGAGLGLIEMAKISGKRIKYEFLPINETYSRFMLWITIDEIQS